MFLPSYHSSRNYRQIAYKDVVEEGVLYISAPYATATHKCACGCGEIVVTPIRPTDWTLTWNGETVTVNPSIGNWSLPCQSHYFIIENKIIWARKWSASEIMAGRASDRIVKDRYYRKFQEQPIQNKKLNSSVSYTKPRIEGQTKDQKSFSSERDTNP